MFDCFSSSFRSMGEALGSDRLAYRVLKVLQHVIPRLLDEQRSRELFLRIRPTGGAVGAAPTERAGGAAAVGELRVEEDADRVAEARALGAAVGAAVEA